MRLEPIGDKVCIRPDAIPEKYGTLYVPQDKEFRPRYGEVLAVGPGAWRYEEAAGAMVRVPMSVRVGQRVAFSQYGTDGIETVDGEEVLIIPEGRILAVEGAEYDFANARPATVSEAERAEAALARAAKLKLAAGKDWGDRVLDFRADCGCSVGVEHGRVVLSVDRFEAVPNVVNISMPAEAARQVSALMAEYAAAELEGVAA
jgi:co-chaperonin GroES (HSP10)